MVMKRNIFYIVILLFPLWFFGCERHDVEKYENDPRLYFFKGNYNLGEFIQGDSTAHSFFVQPDGQNLDTVWVDIRTMGFPADYPRPMKIAQIHTDRGNAAVAGKHYVSFDSEEMQKNLLMPANAVRCLLPVIVKRDPSLETSRVRIEMAVVENEYFKVGIDTLSKFIVTTTARAEKPALWDSYWKHMFGDFGAKKLWFLIHYVGLTEFDAYLSDSGYRYYLQSKAIQVLENYNADVNHQDRPLRETDGTLVTFE